MRPSCKGSVGFGYKTNAYTEPTGASNFSKIL